MEAPNNRMEQRLERKTLSRLADPPFGIPVWMVLLFLPACARSVATVQGPPPPVVLQQAPDITQLASAVNRSDAVRELSTNSARLEVLSMPAVPTLAATMNLQREKRFRLRASLPIIMGSGIDLGSNDTHFWFEIPEGMTQTLYFADHNTYAAQLDRAVLPVDPSWMIQAIGLPRLDPSTVLAGPVTRSDGLIEVRTAETTASGTYQRVLFIEPSAGYVTNIFLYSPDGRLVAKSIASDHRFYDTANVVLPHKVKMELFPVADPPLAMQMEVAAYTINQLLSGDPQLFDMPTNVRNRIDLSLMAAGLKSPASHSIPQSPITYSATLPSGPPLRGTR